MDLFEFGDAKLKLREIDVLYVAVVDAGLTLSKRQRFTLAFVTFDLAGLAAYIADAPDFWGAMYAACAQTLRGAPRRYFRGKVAFAALDSLRGTYGTPEAAIAALHGTFADASGIIARTYPQFGRCAAFKLLDMCERVCGNQLDFSACGIKDIANSGMVQKGIDKACAALNVSPDELLKRMFAHKWASKAGPHNDRKLNQQEFETILCYYSHEDKHNKHMPGMDIAGVRKELLAGRSKLASKIAEHLPTKGEYLC